MPSDQHAAHDPGEEEPAIDLPLETVSTIDELLAKCERSSANGLHLDGAGQAEAVLLRADATPRQQAQARELLALQRLRRNQPLTPTDCKIVNLS